MTYHDIGIPIQIIRDVPLLTLFLDGDERALRRLVPAPLTVHTGHRVVLNIWVADSLAIGTGFGHDERVGVAYLAAEVKGPEGHTVNGRTRYPARYWMRHWCTSGTVSEYARRASGLTLKPAEITLEQQGNCFKFGMRAEDSCRIDACATVGMEAAGSAASRSIYYASRKNGDRNEIAQFDIPAVADTFDVKSIEVACHDIGLIGVISDGPQRVVSSAFRRMTIVPYIASRTDPEQP